MPQPIEKRRTTDCIVTSRMSSPGGPLLLAATREGVCFLEFTDRRAIEARITTLRKQLDRPVVPGRNRHIDRVTKELARYFDGQLTSFKTPLVIAGTPFQEAVWRRLLKIPFGETISYDRLARDIDRAGAQRAVGTANGANRISILIPCHRVIRASGDLGGYGGGLWRKRLLLDLERSVAGGRRGAVRHREPSA
ncbi:MAG: methylated-DNA--[protein]-cysteine S-methyltransferase [Phycisphaerae bacterium]